LILLRRNYSKIKGLFKKKETITVETTPPKQLPPVRSIDYTTKPTTSTSTDSQGRTVRTTTTGGGSVTVRGSGAWKRPAPEVVKEALANPQQETTSQPVRPKSYSLTPESQERINKAIIHQQQVEGIQKKETIQSSGSRVDVPFYIEPTILSKTEIIKDPLTGRGIPETTFTYFDPQGRKIGENAYESTERLLTRAEIDKYNLVPMTVEVGKKETLIGVATTKAQISKQIISRSISEGDFFVSKSGTTVLGSGGYISQGKTFLTEKFLPNPSSIDEDFYGKKYAQGFYDVRAGLIEGIIPETKSQLATTGITLGAGALIGGTIGTGLNVIRAYSPTNLGIATTGTKYVGYGLGSLWAGKQVYSIGTSGSIYEGSVIAGESFRLGTAFIGGSKLGSNFVNEFKYTRAGTEVKITKLKVQKIDQGSLIKTKVSGTAGEYSLSTPEAKPFKGTGEGSIYQQNIKYDYITYRPFKSPVKGSITAPNYRFVSTKFGDITIGSKMIGEGTYEFTGGGRRIDIFSGKEFAYEGTKVGFKDVLSKQYTNLKLSGYSQQIGNKIYISEGTAYLKPIQRITTKTSFGSQPAEYITQGKAFGSGISGRPSIARLGSFDLTTSSISNQEATYIFGQSVGKFLTSRKITPFYFRTISQQIGGGLDITFDSSGGGFIPKIPKGSSIDIGGTSQVQVTKIDTVVKAVTTAPTTINTSPPSTTTITTKTPTTLFPMTSQRTSQTQVSLTRQITSQVPITTQSNRQAMFPTTTQVSPQIFSQVITQSPIQSSLTSQTTSLTSAQALTQIPIQTTTQTPTSITPTIFTPISPTPIVPILPPFRMNFPTGIKSRSVKGKKPRYKYTPDFPSLVLNIKGKQPKGMETGLKIRPIPKNFKWSFGKFEL